MTPYPSSVQKYKTNVQKVSSPTIVFSMLVKDVDLLSLI